MVEKRAPKKKAPKRKISKKKRHGAGVPGHDLAKAYGQHFLLRR